LEDGLDATQERVLQGGDGGLGQRLVEGREEERVLVVLYAGDDPLPR
jgi:hypothetical protein